MDEEQRKELIERIKTAIKTQNEEDLKALAGRLHEVEQALAAAGSRSIGLHSHGPDPFAADAFKQRVKLLSDGHNSTGRIHLAGVKLGGLKALVNGPGVDSPSSGVAGQSQRGPMVGPVTRALSLIDVLPSIPVTANKYDYLRITRTNNAQVQENEGDLKAVSEFESELVTANIATIAHSTNASKQVLSDNPQLATILRNILALDALDKFERELLLGDGTGNSILGLIPQATTIATDEELAPDAISQALAIMFSNNFIANAVVLHPKTWHAIRTMKGEGDGQYLVGSWANPAAPNIWNTPIVQNSAVPQARALLLDTNRVAVLDREQVNVAVSTENVDNFVKNMVTLLAELRGGLIVNDTGGVGFVNLPFGSTG